MTDLSLKEYEDVYANPVKSFFVEMLTRDIELSDAILDLLDNCVDGILRTINKAGKTPYKGFEASITLNKNYFKICKILIFQIQRNMI